MYSRRGVGLLSPSIESGHAPTTSLANVTGNKQAVWEGRQKLPSDYWKEFARGPYLIILGKKEPKTNARDSELHECTRGASCVEIRLERFRKRLEYPE